MRISMRANPGFVSRYYAALPAKIRAAVIQAERENILLAKAAAIEGSSGPHSLSDLSEADHPYSTRSPQPGLFPPQIINEQSGRFAGSWKTSAPSLDGNVVRNGNGGAICRTLVFNTDPKKIFLQGTTKMVPRGVAEYVRIKIQVVRRQKLSDALRKAFAP